MTSLPSTSRHPYFNGAAGEVRLALWRSRIEKLARQEMDKVHPQQTFEVPVKHPERFQPGNSGYAAAVANCRRFAAELQAELGTDGYTSADGRSFRITAECQEQNGLLRKFSLAVTLV